MDELEQRISGGYEAQEILSSPAYVEAFEQIEQEYTQAWMNSPARDEAAREKLYLMLKLLHKVKGHLALKITDGKMAQVTLDDRNKAQKAMAAVRDWTGF